VLHLSESEVKLLKKIQKGELEDSVSLPHDVNQLIAKGLVESTTVLTFPIMPPRKYYRLTVYGKYTLNNQPAH
jgi:DNA-binding HxlR family transcriptional regulator